MSNWRKYRKWIVGSAAIASTLLSLSLIPGPYDKYVTAALAILGSLGIRQAPNARA